MVPHLPNEIHHAIAQYLSSRDLANYRLVSRDLAEIGAEELFRTLKFHASRRSTNHIRAAAAHGEYRFLVKALVWDANLWDIGEFHFEQYEEVVRTRHPDKPKVTPAHFKKYQRRRKEEVKLREGLLKSENLKGLIRCFHSLHKIYVTNGNFEFDHRRVTKRDALAPVPKSWQPIVRGMCMHNFALEDDIAGLHALTNFARAAPKTLTKLRVDALDYRFFFSSMYPKGLENEFPNLISIRLKITCLREEESIVPIKAIKDCWHGLESGNLKTFLKGMTKLQSLTLEFEEREKEDANGSAYISDCFSWSHVWPSLRKLSLKNLDTSPRRIMKIIKEHSSTLHDLRLYNVYLNPKGSWIEVFVTLRSYLRLKSVTMKGHLGSVAYPNDYGWEVDDELGQALSAYLISGGECPITLENTRMAIRKKAEGTFDS